MMKIEHCTLSSDVPITEPDDARLPDLLFGFSLFQTAVTAHEVGLLAALEEQPQTAAQLQDTLGVNPHGLRVLLMGCCKAGLLVRNRQNGTYALGAVAKKLLL